MKLFVVAITLVIAQASFGKGSYCLALRGNGESEPAHWGALANLVEQVGLPQAQSGGSSAAISIFLLDSIAANPWVSRATQAEQKSRAALLLKSMMGVTQFLQTTETAKVAMDLYGQLKELQTTNEGGSLTDILKELAANPSSALLTRNKDKIYFLVNQLQKIGIGNSDKYFSFYMTLVSVLGGRPLSQQDSAVIAFHAEELQQAIAVLGKFDAESDQTLFFRSGIIDFKQLALATGRIGSFLSATQYPSKTLDAMNNFEKTCAPLHLGKTWPELVTQEPRCHLYLQEALASYFSDFDDKNNAALTPIGHHIPSFPTTAVLVDSAYRQAFAAYEQYHRTFDRKVALSFRIAKSSDVRFGFWGKDSDLKKIEKNLPVDDEKSSRFLKLGTANWQEALRLSPAEPGLASFQELSVGGSPAYSAGGWSDLHPVLVLRSLGCENVVYLTRKGGESLFGQGIAKRLLNFERSWEFLRTSDPQLLPTNVERNNLGDASDLTTLWSRLYNVANPKSSYMRSVAAADAVLCTNWNDFDVKSQLNELVTDSYRAPWVVLKSNTFTSAFTNRVQNPRAAEFVGCRPN